MTARKLLKKILQDDPRTVLIFYYNGKGELITESAMDSNFYDPAQMYGYIQIFNEFLKKKCIDILDEGSDVFNKDVN